MVQLVYTYTIATESTATVSAVDKVIAQGESGSSSYQLLSPVMQQVSNSIPLIGYCHGLMLVTAYLLIYGDSLDVSHSGKWPDSV